MILKHTFPRSSRYGKLAWFCFLGLAILTLLAACGGSNTSTSSSPTPTSTSALISGAPTDTPTSAGSTPTSTPTASPQSTPTPTPTPPPRPTPTPTPKPRPTPTPTPRPTPTPTPHPKVTITIITKKNGTFAFSPATISVAPDTLVIWVNATQAPHTVTGSSFGSGTINPGGSYSFTFTSAGTYAYHCSFHPYMTGKVNVT